MHRRQIKKIALDMTIDDFNGRAKTYGDDQPEVEKSFRLKLVDEAVKHFNLMWGPDSPTPQEPNVLDIGCANGLTAELIRKRLPQAKIHGLDFAANMVKEAKQRGHIQTGEVKDIATAPPRMVGTFNLVTSFLVSEHTPRPKKMIANIGASLKKDGVFAGTQQAFHAEATDVMMKMRPDGTIDIDPEILATITQSFPMTKAQVRKVFAQNGMDVKLMTPDPISSEGENVSIVTNYLVVAYKL